MWVAIYFEFCIILHCQLKLISISTMQVPATLPQVPEGSRTGLVLLGRFFAGRQSKVNILQPMELRMSNATHLSFHFLSSIYWIVGPPHSHQNIPSNPRPSTTNFLLASYWKLATKPPRVFGLVKGGMNVHGKILKILPFSLGDKSFLSNYIIYCSRLPQGCA